MSASPSLVMNWHCGVSDRFSQGQTNAFRFWVFDISAMPLFSTVLRPKFVWTGEVFEEGISIRINHDGIISEIGADISNKIEDNVVYWPNQAIVPGFVNTHSHAFHRHLRGRSEIGNPSGDTFWRWRDNMYGLVENVDWDRMKELCLTTFKEMLSAGITTVGEFHYVHHGEHKFDLDSAVISAANEAGIRLVLLTTLYRRAGFDNPQLHPVQEKRFVSGYEDFIVHVENLLKINSPTLTIGVAAHSARAVSFDEIAKLFAWAQGRKLPFHIHLEEQPKECSDCQIQQGSRDTPVDMLLRKLKPDALFTGVHLTYTSAENMKKLTEFGANACICPCTEGYLGDGVPIISSSTALSFGTDCNNRICFLEEMRWAAFSQHTKHNSRNVADLSATRLLQHATQGGARSLNLSQRIGAFQPGMAFDFVGFSLDSPVLAKLSKETLADGIVFSCGNREISTVGVQGRILVGDM